MDRRIVRYLSALVLFTYGFAKINGSQFTILDSELDKPMGDVSGFWLTWYYFGYSAFYGNLIALVQIGGALLLTFRRTTLLGACLLLPVLGNIILVDLFYGVGLGAMGVAILLFAAMISLIAPQRRELLTLFWPPANDAANSPALAARKWAVRVAMLVATCGFTYWVANYNNRVPTPLDGVWDVVRVEPEPLAAQLPQSIFFEYNRAFMVVFKNRSGAYETHHFVANPDGNQIHVTETWLRQGTPIFDGAYALNEPVLKLDGIWQNAGAVVLELRRRVAQAH